MKQSSRLIQQLLFGVFFVHVQALSTRLQVQIPRSLTKPAGYDHRAALFGTYPYGGSIQQEVFYAESTLCNANDISAMNRFPPPFILMIDRGECTFVRQVRNAQRAGASAVIIADDLCLCSHEECYDERYDEYDSGLSVCQDTLPIMADDGSGADVTIPSVLMFKEDSDKIKQTFQQTQSSVIMSISFDFPKEGSHVNYDLWATPTDPLSKHILLSFKEMAVQLRTHASFTPHWYIYDGRQAGCYGADGTNQCFTLCTNHGRYCCTDPDDNLDKGISGADVVKESLRRICIWNRYGQDGIGREWWDYVQEFETQCATMPFAFISNQCIAKALQVAGIDQDSIDACMEDSGSLEEDFENSLLEAALKSEVDAGIVLIPSVNVNGIQMRGALSPINLFDAVCASLAKNAQPDVCFQCAHCPDKADCIKNGSCSTPIVGPKSKQKGGAVSFLAFAGSIFLLIGTLGTVMYFYRQREHQRRRDLVRDIMAEYMPLSDAT